MIIEIFLFFLIFALVLGIAGFKYIGSLKYGAQAFHISSAFLLLMCGLIILTQGVDFKIGSVVTDTSPTVTTISYTYSHIQGGLAGSYGISFLLILLSFAFFMYIFFEVKYARKNEASNTQYGEEE